MDFRAGKQPCNEYNPQLESNEHGIWDNQHQCYKCGGVVSFCLNCNRDHHENGYESCVKITTE